MTQLDPGTRTERIPHRSWRDLPASPPVTDEFATASQTVAIADTEVVPEAPVAAPPPPTPPRWRRWLVPAGLFAAFVVAALAILAIRGGEATTATVAGGEVGNPASVAAALGPAVVQIDVFGGLDAGGGVGSGVIYDDAGLVLTAHHVVSFGDEVTVRTADDRTFTGRVVGRAPERDLAVVSTLR